MAVIKEAAVVRKVAVIQFAEDSDIHMHLCLYTLYYNVQRNKYQKLKHIDLTAGGWEKHTKAC